MAKSNALTVVQQGKDKLERMAQRDRSSRIEHVNDRLQRLSLADQQVIARITAVQVQSDIDIASLKREEELIHEELKKSALYKKLLATRQKIKWAREHKKDCATTLKKLSEALAEVRAEQEQALLNQPESNNVYEEVPSSVSLVY